MKRLQVIRIEPKNIPFASIWLFDPPLDDFT